MEIDKTPSEEHNRGGQRAVALQENIRNNGGQGAFVQWPENEAGKLAEGDKRSDFVEDK